MGKYDDIINMKWPIPSKRPRMANTLKLDADYDENVTFSYVLKDENINNKIVEITRGLVPTCIGKEIIQKVVK